MLAEGEELYSNILYRDCARPMASHEPRELQAREFIVETTVRRGAMQLTYVLRGIDANGGSRFS